MILLEAAKLARDFLRVIDGPGVRRIRIQLDESITEEEKRLRKPTRCHTFETLGDGSRICFECDERRPRGQ